MDYSQLHDAQINMMVCKALGLELSSYARIIMQDDATILLSDNKTLVDYCNNPADAWPIILNNGINVFTDMIPHGLLGQARASVISPEPPNSECIIAKDANPLRAAMIVYLMMQDTKHA